MRHLLIVPVLFFTLSTNALALGMARDIKKMVKDDTVTVIDGQGTAEYVGFVFGAAGVVVQAKVYPVDAVEVYRVVYRNQAGKEAKIAYTKVGREGEKDQELENLTGLKRGVNFTRIKEGEYYNYFKLEKVATYAKPNGVAVMGSQTSLQDAAKSFVPAYVTYEPGAKKDEQKIQALIVTGYFVYGNLPLNTLEVSSYKDVRYEYLFKQVEVSSSPLQVKLTSANVKDREFLKVMSVPGQLQAMEAIEALADNMKVVFQSDVYARKLLEFNTRRIGIRLFDASAYGDLAEALSQTNGQDDINEYDSLVNWGVTELWFDDSEARYKMPEGLSDDEVEAFKRTNLVSSLRPSIVKLPSGALRVATVEDIKKTIDENREDTLMFLLYSKHSNAGYKRSISEAELREYRGRMVETLDKLVAEFREQAISNN